MRGCGIRISDEAPQNKTRKTMTFEEYLQEKRAEREKLEKPDEAPQKKTMKTITFEDYMHEKLVEREKLEKRKNIPKIPKTELHVGIISATDIDINTKDPAGNKRIYYVRGWVNPEESFVTSISGTLPNPRWDELHKLYSLNYDMYLHIEVYRCRSIVGPETSQRTVLVGRGRLLVPNEIMTRGEVKRCGLVTPDGLAAGFIHVELMLTLKETKTRRKFFLV